MTDTPASRIGIIGSGAIGGYYGALLARAGHEVHFLLRSEYDAVMQNGLLVRHASLGDLQVKPVNAWKQMSEMPACDWLLVGAKSTSNVEIAALLAQAAPGTRVVLLQNGLGVEDDLRSMLPDELHLLGGLCYILVHREAPGVVVHQAQGVCNLGYHSGLATPQEQQAMVEEGVALLRSAGIDSSALADLNTARWQKLVWNVPYNGLSVLLDADTGSMMRHPGTRQLIEQLMQEVVDAATALGCTLPNHCASKLMAFTDKLPDYLPSMYHDFRLGRPAEIAAIYDAPLQAAAEAGIEMPRVRMLRDALQFIQDRREAGGAA